MSVSPSDLAESPALAATPAPHARELSGRLLIVASVILVILLLINALVCATFAYFFSLPGWLLWQAIPGSLVAAFFATTIFGFRYTSPLFRLLYTVSAAWIGAMNFAFFAAAACWLIYGITLLPPAPIPRPFIALTFFGFALTATVYGLVNAAWIRTTRITAHLPNLPAAWQGRTVALVTDLHLGHVRGPKFLQRVISRLQSLHPDAVFISGDMFDGSPLGLPRLVAPWKNYSAPRGIYYVTGNHDEFAERKIYLDAVSATGVRVLNNEKITLDGLQLVGVHDSEAGNPHQLHNILQRACLDSSPSILLAHRPVNLSVAEEAGISLQLSGHTHRGQLWPWNLLVAKIFGPFAYGLHRHGNLQVYTSSGVGTWGPPLRVATKSELVLIRLEKSA